MDTHSVFENFSNQENSFDFLFKENEYKKLYAVCVSANYFKPDSILDSEDGFELISDRISSIQSEHLTLAATNMLFYVYKSTYKKCVKTCHIYSQIGCTIIKDYLMQHIDNALLEKSIGFIKHTDEYGKSYTYLLTSQKVSNKVPFIFYRDNPKRLGVYTLSDNYLFEQALIWKLFDGKTNIVDLSPGNSYSPYERDMVFDYVENKYSSMTFMEKYMYGFILSHRFKNPQDDELIPKILRTNYIARINNLWNCITYQYKTRIFEDRFFESAKIEYQYGDQYFKQLVDSVGAEIVKGRYRDIWFESCRGNNLIYLRILLFLNWIYVSNERNVLKKITACWLYYIIYDALQNCCMEDRCFWEIMMAYVLIENETIYNALFRLSEPSINTNIVSNLVRYYIKDKTDLSEGLSPEQKNYLSSNIEKSSFIQHYIYKKKKSEKSLQTYIWSGHNLFLRLKKIIESSEYSNNTLIKDLAELPSLPIPRNFYYTAGSKFYNSGSYSGTYAHDVMRYSNSDIETIFDGDPSAYWNID